MVGMIHVLLSASRRAVLEMAAGLRKQRRKGDARSCVFDTDARSATDHLFRAAGGKDALARKKRCTESVYVVDDISRYFLPLWRCSGESLDETR